MDETNVEATSATHRPALGTRKHRLASIAQVLAAAMILAASYLAHDRGLIPGVLDALTNVAAVGAIASRAAGAKRGQLELRLIRNPFEPKMRPHLFQLANRLVFWGLVGLAVEVALQHALLIPGSARTSAMVRWGSIATLMLLSFIPRKRIVWVTNLAMAAISLFLAAQLGRIAFSPPTGEAVTLQAPFDGTWVVISGGSGSLINHHYGLAQQRHALDLVRLEQGKARRGKSSDLASFASFGEVLSAPADGTVVEVEEGMPDLPLGATDDKHPLGNHVVVRIAVARYVVFAHLKHGSVRVSKGENVAAGQPLAEVGNSGNTGGPHLHLQVQSGPRLMEPDGEGWTKNLRTFPILLVDATRLRGDTKVSPATDLRRNDVLEMAR